MRKLTHEEFVDKVGSNKIKVIGKYKLSRKKIQFRCEVCLHDWLATPNNILRGRGCPKCAMETKGYKLRKSNKILEDHGEWLLIDISTKTHPNATMAIDSDYLSAHIGGRMRAISGGSTSYITSIYNAFSTGNCTRKVHRSVISAGHFDEVDHICHGTRNFIDNRKSNLRIVNRSQNCMNTKIRSDNKSGVKGVSFVKNKWVARIRKNNKEFYLGGYDCKADAVKARMDAEIDMFGTYSYSANNKGV